MPSIVRTCAPSPASSTHLGSGNRCVDKASCVDLGRPDPTGSALRAVVRGSQGGGSSVRGWSGQSSTTKKPESLEVLLTGGVAPGLSLGWLLRGRGQPVAASGGHPPACVRGRPETNAQRASRSPTSPPSGACTRTSCRALDPRCPVLSGRASRNQGGACISVRRHRHRLHRRYPSRRRLSTATRTRTYRSASSRKWPTPRGRLATNLRTSACGRRRWRRPICRATTSSSCSTCRAR